MESSGDLPSLRSASSAKSIIMMAFFLTMPISRMMPMSATTPNSVRQSRRARMAPTPEEGGRGALECTLNAGRHVQFLLGTIHGVDGIAERRTRSEVEGNRHDRKLALMV